MKKTLITFAALALASVAQAASVTDSYTLSDFENGKLTLKSALDFKNDFTITASITIGAADANNYGTPLITTTVNNFYDGTVERGGFKLYLTGKDNGNGNDKLYTTFADDYYGGAQQHEATKITKVSPGNILTLTYTYTADTKLAKMTFSDGTNSDTRSATLSEKDIASISAIASAIGTGSAVGTDWGLDLSVTYNVSDTPAIPEPTTATLSLLALAGLAARRRRK